MADTDTAPVKKDDAQPADDLRQNLSETFEDLEGKDETEPVVAAEEGDGKDVKPDDQEQVSAEKGVGEEKPSDLEAAEEEKPAEEPTGEEPAPEEPVEAEKPEEEAAEPAEPIIEAPHGWTEPEKKIFADLTPEVQKIISSREKERETVLQSKFQENAEHRKRSETMLNAFEPYRQQFALAGTSEPIEVFNQLLAVYSFLGRDLGPAISWLVESFEGDPTVVIRHLAAQHGINLEDIEPTKAEDVTPPAVRELGKRLVAVETNIADERAGVARRAIEDTNTTIETFKTATDENGNLQHPHFATVQFETGALLAANVRRRSIDSAIPEMTLADAYEKAVLTHPELRPKAQASAPLAEESKQEKDEEARRLRERDRAKKAKAAARAIETTPEAESGKSSDKPAESLRQALSRNLEQLSAAE